MFDIQGFSQPPQHGSGGGMPEPPVMNRPGLSGGCFV